MSSNGNAGAAPLTSTPFYASVAARGVPATQASTVTYTHYPHSGNNNISPNEQSISSHASSGNYAPRSDGPIPLFSRDMSGSYGVPQQRQDAQRSQLYQQRSSYQQQQQQQQQQDTGRFGNYREQQQARPQRENNSFNGAATNQHQTNLYVRGLSHDATDEKLRKLCENLGTIVSTKAIIDKSTGLCKGYGFIDFDSHEAARNAIEQLNNRGVQAQLARQEHDPTNLYMANIPLEVVEQELESVLNKFGEVISSRILRNSDNQSRGVGFARMVSPAHCERAIRELNGQLFPGHDETTSQPLLVKLADTNRKKKMGAYNTAFGFNYQTAPDAMWHQLYANAHQPGQYMNGTTYYYNQMSQSYQPAAAAQQQQYYGQAGYSNQVDALSAQMSGLAMENQNAANAAQRGYAAYEGVAAGQQQVVPQQGYMYPQYAYGAQYGVQQQADQVPQAPPQQQQQQPQAPGSSNGMYPDRQEQAYGFYNEEDYPGQINQIN